MKATVIMALFSLNLSALAGNEATEKFKVYGVCDMCKERIEKNAKKAGASKADWDEASSMLTVTFDESKTSLEKIEKAVVRAGHDTDKLKAEDKAYDKLPHCCHYPRQKAG